MVVGWSSLVARQAHNLKVAGSNPAPATNFIAEWHALIAFAFFETLKADFTSVWQTMSHADCNSTMMANRNGRRAGALGALFGKAQIFR